MNFLDQFADDAPRSVSDLTREIKSLLEARIASCWVKGEVSNLRRQSSGHLYFTLKDQRAQIPSVMFRGHASRLECDLRDGMEVNAYGEISVYEPHGRYQFVTRTLVESGSGRLYREFERLKRKLSEEGLFDAQRKRPVPKLPFAIAVVTSPTGAAVQDFIRVLKRRDWSGRLSVLPSKVQGEGAVDEIVSNIEWANASSLFDLIVLTRGGGSIEDLWCFNDERVARAIADSRLPIVSAVGHEIDTTLSDFVADARSETPSAAAEMISSARLEIVDRLGAASSVLEGLLDARLRNSVERVRYLATRMRAMSPVSKIEYTLLRIDDIANRLSECAHRQLATPSREISNLERRLLRIDPKLRVSSLARRLDSLKGDMGHAFESGYGASQSRLDRISGRLRALSPESILRRGFAHLADAKGKSIVSVEQVVPGAPIKATLADGSVVVRTELP